MRLIDASELVQVLCVNMDSGEQFDKATHCVDAMPTVDAVPVIRCKDCKHCMIFSMFTSKWYVCCRNEKGVNVKADDFCSYAERGNNEAD